MAFATAGYVKKPLVVRVGKSEDFAALSKKLDHSVDIQTFLFSQFYNSDSLESYHVVLIR